MLILTRRIGEVFYLDLPDGHGRVEIRLAGIRGNLAQVGINAPKSVSITRAELEKPRAQVAPVCAANQPNCDKFDTLKT